MHMATNMDVVRTLIFLGMVGVALLLVIPDHYAAAKRPKNRTGKDTTYCPLHRGEYSNCEDKHRQEGE